MSVAFPVEAPSFLSDATTPGSHGASAPSVSQARYVWPSRMVMLSMFLMLPFASRSEASERFEEVEISPE